MLLPPGRLLCYCKTVHITSEKSYEKQTTSAIHHHRLVFNNGNKRTALLSMLIFLELNGYSVACNEDAVADQIVFLADGKSDFKRFSVWLKGKVTPF